MERRNVIFVDRSAVKEPEVLRTLGLKEFEKARHFYAEAAPGRRQRKFPFIVYRHRDVRKALTELFHGKCAYCETYATGSSLDIELFRPKGGDLRRFRARQAKAEHLLFDRAPTLRELRDDGLGDTGDRRVAVPNRSPIEAEGLGQS